MLEDRQNDGTADGAVNDGFDFGAVKSPVNPTEAKTYVDRTSVHYIWVALSDLFIGHRNYGATYLGDFPGEIIRAKRPIPIHSTLTLAPLEAAAMPVSSFEMAANTMTPQMVDAEGAAPVAQLSNLAGDLVDFLQQEFHNFGVAAFGTLTRRSEEEVSLLFRAAFNAEHFKSLENVRVVEGVKFSGPFLDQIREYLRSETPHVLRDIRKVEPDFEPAVEDILLNVQRAVETAWSFGTTKLNETEAIIRSSAKSGHGKASYDMPDYRFPNPIMPLDLVCLAQLNRTPISLKEVAASRDMSIEVGRSIQEGLRGLLAGAAPAVEPSEPMIPASQVSQLLEEVQAMRSEIDAFRADKTLGEAGHEIKADKPSGKGAKSKAASDESVTDESS